MDENYQSVATLGHRVSDGINGLDQDNVSSEVLLVPWKTFAGGLWHPRRDETWSRLVDDVDIVVIIKSSVFKDFDRTCTAFSKLAMTAALCL